LFARLTSAQTSQLRIFHTTFFFLFFSLAIFYPTSFCIMANGIFSTKLSTVPTFVLRNFLFLYQFFSRRQSQNSFFPCLVFSVGFCLFASFLHRQVPYFIFVFFFSFFYFPGDARSNPICSSPSASAVGPDLI
jgi:hypothetical protein